MIALGYVGLQQNMIALPGAADQQSQQSQQFDMLQDQLAELQGRVEGLSSVDLGALEAQVTALDERMQALTGDAAASGDGETLGAVLGQISDLSGRLATMQQQLGSLEEQAIARQQKFGEDLAAAKEEVLSSADRRIDNVVTDLSNLSDETTTQTASLGERITALEENNLSAKMQNSAQTIALAGLETAVSSGSSYQIELSTFSNVVGENPALDVLAEHAGSGVPTAEQLADRFDGVYDGVLREAEEAGAATLLDKFLINAQSLVRVRSLTGEQQGESLTSKLGVVQYHVDQGDLKAAAEAWNALPDAAREAEAGSDWLADLQARIAVNDAMEQILAEFGANAEATAN